MEIYLGEVISYEIDLASVFPMTPSCIGEAFYPWIDVSNIEFNYKVIVRTAAFPLCFVPAPSDEGKHNVGCPQCGLCTNW